MKLIPLTDHPSNLDPTARIVYDFGRPTADCVFAVKGGHMIAVGMKTADRLFATMEEARDFIRAIHAGKPWQWRNDDGEWCKRLEPSRSHAKCAAMSVGNQDYELRPLRV